MPTIPLLQSAQAVAGVDGVAVIRLGPTIYGTTWTVTGMSVNSDSVNVPRVDTFRNTIAATAFLEGTNSGNADTSDSHYDLLFGDALVFQFRGCDPGSNCIVVITGKQEGR